MARNKFIIEKSRLLIGEGRDEVEFLRALTRDLGCSDESQIEDFGGKTELSSFLSLVARDERFSRLSHLLVTRDADESFDAAFSSVQHALRKNGLPTPAWPGVVASKDRLTVSVWIMPNNSRAGMLEDLILESLDRDPTMSCIRAFEECARPLTGPWNSKSRVRAWLAAKCGDVASVGIAAQRGLFDLRHAVFGDFRRLIHS